MDADLEEGASGCRASGVAATAVEEDLVNAEGNGTEKLVVPFWSNAKFRMQLAKLGTLDPADKGILKVEGKDGMGVGILCLEELCEALKDNMALRKLDFDNTQLGDQGVATLCGMLRVNTRVHKIDLQGCNVSDKGFENLVDVLIGRQINLKELYMSRNGITDEATGKILELCARYPGLKFYSGNTDITELRRSETSDAILKMTTAKYIAKMRQEEAALAAAAEDEEDSDDVQLIPPRETRRQGGDGASANVVREREAEEEEEDLPLRQRSKPSARTSRHAALLETSSSEGSDTPEKNSKKRSRLKRADSASSSSSDSLSSGSDDSFLDGPSVRRKGLNDSSANAAADSDSDKSCFIVT
eukprot:Tamp_13766.p1 GENE.Tamp_13766~~Tamp_13766.p1  ORF type:complete len:359 (-),score=96.92 Tamp_13766:114-1190(-)